MGEKTQLVSVIIPVYNVEKFIGKCLDTATNQTYKNLEIIVVNDGTKDDSLAICYRYAEKDERIRIITKENGGLSSARNAGLEVATGDLCYFYDSDDYIELNAIECMVELQEKEQADLVVVNVDHVTEDGEKVLQRRIKDATYLIQNDEQRMEFLTGIYYNRSIGFEVWNKLFDLHLIRNYHIRFEDNYKVFAEDICFLSYYLQHVSKIVAISDTFYHYLVRDDSIMGQSGCQPKIKNFLYMIQLVKHYIHKVGEDSCLDRQFNMIAGQMLHIRYINFRSHQFRKILSDLDEAEKQQYQEIIAYILTNKKFVKKYYNRIKDYWGPLGNMIIEETIIARSALSLKYSIGVINVYIVRAVRKVGLLA